MKRTLLAPVVASTILFTSAFVLAMGGSHGKGNPKAPTSAPGWSPGLVELINREDRVGGFWVNQFDSYTYAGDVRAFNEFVAKYAALPEGPHLLALTPPPAATTRPSAFPEVDGDWMMATDSHWGKAAMDVRAALFVGRRIKLEDVVLPAGLHVSLVGEPTEEVEAFLARYPNALAAPATGPTTRTTD
jgi:hypothetical protein